MKKKSQEKIRVFKKRSRKVMKFKHTLNKKVYHHYKLHFAHVTFNKILILEFLFKV